MFGGRRGGIFGSQGNRILFESRRNFSSTTGLKESAAFNMKHGQGLTTLQRNELHKALKKAQTTGQTVKDVLKANLLGKTNAFGAIFNSKALDDLLADKNINDYLSVAMNKKPKNVLINSNLDAVELDQLRDHEVGLNLNNQVSKQNYSHDVEMIFNNNGHFFKFKFGMGPVEVSKLPKDSYTKFKNNNYPDQATVAVVDHFAGKWYQDINGLWQKV